MAAKPLSAAQLQEAADLYAKHGTEHAAAAALGISRDTFRSRLLKARAAGTVTAQVKPSKPRFGDSTGALTVRRMPLPETGVARYILASQQNSTKVEPATWRNLLALAKHYGAQILVSRFTYNRAAYEVRGNAKPNTGADTYSAAWYDKTCKDYWCDDRVQLAPHLVFCGELNILPTAARPLSGFESYTGRDSCVIPHPKIAMESVAGYGDNAVKLMYTTGCVTKQNYVQQKAGQKAGFHHCFGALLVEVLPDGAWYCRQLNADKSGTIYDLWVRAKGGKVTGGHRAEAVNWGDIHEAEMDPGARKLQFGVQGILDTLRPRYQFMHDALSFRSRNHHDARDPILNFAKALRHEDRVSAEVSELAAFLDSTAHRSWCETIVVDSNHDQALMRWLREADPKQDPRNALTYHRCMVKVLEAIQRGEDDYHLLPDLLREYGLSKPVRFLREGESFVLCPEAGDGIECGMHGHAGPNGSRGSPRAFGRMGRRANTGHTHSAGIVDGVYTAGTSTGLGNNAPGYARGKPSSWTQSFIVTYANGKRAIYTIWNGRAWA